MKKTEYNALTDETFETEMSAKEIKQFEKDQEIDAAAKALAQAEADAKAAQRQALLTRLGITEEEASILLGGN